MKSFIPYVIFFFISVFLYGEEPLVKINKMNYDGQNLTYEIEVENSSEGFILLTDINGEFYSIRDNCLFVELFSHNESQGSTIGNYENRFNLNTKFLAPGEKVILNRTLNVIYKRFNDCMRGSFDDFEKNEKKFNTICFLVGHIEYELMIDNSNFGYNWLSNHQSISSFISKAAFSNLLIDEQLSYLFNDLRFFSFEIEDYIYCSIMRDEIKFHKKFIDSYLIRILDTREFYSRGERDYSLDKVFYILKLRNDRSAKQMLKKIKEKIFTAIENNDLSEYEKDYYLAFFT